MAQLRYTAPAAAKRVQPKWRTMRFSADEFIRCCLFLYVLPKGFQRIRR